METPAGRVISTILKHDDKVTSYKIALLRAINDVVMAYPDLVTTNKDLAIPLRTLARFWLAYYWPFFDGEEIILQGPRAIRSGKLTNDMAFRNHLTEFRNQWSVIAGEKSQPADGFFIINELNIPRKRRTYPNDLIRSFDQVVTKISHTIQMPIRYAGEGQWSVFDRPKPFSALRDICIGVPGTKDKEICVVVSTDLWQGFQDMSLYIDALCIHEWSMFTERKNENPKYERGYSYRLLTERPDNRRPLTWERNQVDLLLMENKEFVCPWTEKRIKHHVKYDMDHLIPVSVYPINELWNLVPSDPHFNTNKKRNRMPTNTRLKVAQPHLKLAYNNYGSIPSTSQAIREDAHTRFACIHENEEDLPDTLVKSVVQYISMIADTRNVARF